VADRERAPSVLHAYQTVIGARVRSQLVYRTSFWLDVLGSMMIAGIDFIEIYVVFHNVPTLGGLNFTEAFLVFGLATFTFALGDIACGNLDTMPTYIRGGTLDVMLLRPMPLLAQLITGEVRLRRLGRAGVGIAVLVLALSLADIRWTVPTLALLVMSTLSGAAVFAALFLVAGASQFWLVDAGELCNSFTYGSQYAARYSSGALPLPVRILFVFIIPAGFTAYLPALVILGKPGPEWVPAWLGWCTPVAAVLTWALALGLWRCGIRHYTGAGG
jgi:ABC-2 type transport system permease protein